MRLPRPVVRSVRVVHLGRSTCNAISGREDQSPRIPDHLSWSRRGHLLSSHSAYIILKSILCTSF